MSKWQTAYRRLSVASCFQALRRGYEARQRRRRSASLPISAMEVLEDRLLLATANGGLTYTAAAGETNDVVLSPGDYFSIQDADDVVQFGTGGCVPSDFLAGIGVDIGTSLGGSLGIGTEVSWDVGIGVGFPMFGYKLPDGVICPNPTGMSSASDIGDSIQDSLGRLTEGVSSAVAGATAEQAGRVYYKVSAANGTVDEYILYQAIVDPGSGTNESEDNDTVSRADLVETSKLVTGDLDTTDDVDFFRFRFEPGPDTEFAVVLDNDPDKDGLYANTSITLYDSYGNELGSNVSFSDGHALGGVEVDSSSLLFPATYYLAVADNGFGDDTDYQFVVIEAAGEADEDQTKTITKTVSPNAAIPDEGEIESSMMIDMGNSFAHPDDVEVTLNIDHTFDADLEVYLESPSGIIVELFTNVGGNGDNFTDTVLSDTAPISITHPGPIPPAPTAPFTGVYQPEGSLSAFSNGPMSGEWTLHVRDDSEYDVGTLVDWTLKLTVRTNESADMADSLGLSESADGRVISNSDLDFFKVESGAIDVGDLVFAYVDTHDRDDEDAEKADSYLTVFSANGTDVIAEDDDDGPAVSAHTFNQFTDDLDDMGLDLFGLAGSFGGTLTVEVKDGNDTIDASKLNLIDQKIVLDGGINNDTIHGPAGNDVHLIGGSGMDTFIFNNLAAALVDADGGTGLDTLLVEGTDSNDQIRIAMSGADLLITVNGVEGRYTNIAGAGLEALEISAGDGEDVIIVDSSEGAISAFSEGIGIAGEGGIDHLRFVAGSDVATSNTITLGPFPGWGASEITIDGQTQEVSFDGFDPTLETITDLVIGPLEIITTPTTERITLTGDPATDMSLLQVDNLASIAFGDKNEVAIDAGAGNDDIQVELSARHGFFAPGDDLILSGGDGNDSIVTADGLEVFLSITLNGDNGDDYLKADATVNGGAGDDSLIGGVGNNTYDGGDGFDSILILGTPGNDNIDVKQTAADTLTHAVNADSGTDTFQNVEAIRVEALDGDDEITVSVTHSLTGSLPITVVGDAPNANDRLTYVDDGAGDVIVVRQGANDQSGSLAVGNLASVNYTGIEDVDVTPLNGVTGGTGDDGLGRIVVLDRDPFEMNDSRLNATDITALDSTSHNPTIDKAGDEDWYLFRSPKIGTFRFDVFFETFAGLPSSGTLEVDLFNASGTLIASSSVTPDGEQITFSTAKDKQYYLRVRGATSDAVNVYDVSLTEVDILGPQLFDPDGSGGKAAVHITDDGKTTTRDESLYDLFDPKPSTDGPTPTVNSLTIHVRDLLTRDLQNRAPENDDVYPALDPMVAAQPGHYRLVGDHSGAVAISNVIVTNDPVLAGQVATGTIILEFSEALPDDRFTLTISDSVKDPAGNSLDGESNTLEPQESPAFPTGDGVSGGDFVARFTVDSRPEIGVIGQGSIAIDINGNRAFDPTNGLTGGDATNDDFVFDFGIETDAIFAGQFTDAAAVTADGFDRLGAYGLLNGTYRWLLDFDNDGVADNSPVWDPGAGTASLLQEYGTPIAGDFDPSHPGDEIGLFTGTTWYFDTDGDNNLGSSDRHITGNMQGQPIVGDFDGDGLDDLGTHLATSTANRFYFDLTSADDGSPGVLDGSADDTIDFGFPGVLERPFAADFNLDGIDDVGLKVPSQEGDTPADVSEWYFLISEQNAVSPGTVGALDHPFSPAPLGDDLFAQFGSNMGLALVGNFDPPVGTGDDSAAVDCRFNEGTGSLTVTLLDSAEVVVGATGGYVNILVNGVADGSLGLRLANEVQQIVVRGSYGDDLIDLSAVGVDTYANVTNVLITGAAGDDTLVGSSFGDVIDGNGGDDQVMGNAGNDRLSGSQGNDVLQGGAGNDVVLGGCGRDSLSGGAGDDVLNGQGGRDTLIEAADVDLTLSDTQLTGLGTDRLGRIETAELSGGASDNGLDARDFTGTTTLSGGPGNDMLIGGRAASVLQGGSGNDCLVGDVGDDQLSGDDGDDTLWGGDGNDVLSGGRGDDIVLGGSGGDLVQGDEDHDTLAGGSGQGADAGDTVIGEPDEIDETFILDVEALLDRL